MKKTCPKCKKSMPTTEFWKRKDALQPYCKACSKATTLAYGKENSQRLNAKRREKRASDEQYRLDLNRRKREAWRERWRTDPKFRANIVRLAKENRSKHRQVGLCSWCSNKALDGRSRCEKCLQKHNAKNANAYRANPEKHRDKNALNRYKHKPRETAYKRAYSQTERQRQLQREYREKHREERNSYSRERRKRQTYAGVANYWQNAVRLQAEWLNKKGQRNG